MVIAAVASTTIATSGDGIENEAESPTLGSTPAMIENEIASGIRASATTRPDKMSAFGFDSHADCQFVTCQSGS